MLQFLTDSKVFIDEELSFRQILRFVASLWANKGSLVHVTWPLLLPVLLFVGYVVHTGSIVLGKVSCYRYITWCACGPAIAFLLNHFVHFLVSTS